MNKGKIAKEILLHNEHSFVLVNEEQTYTSDKQGIAPILDLLNSNEEAFHGATVADKVIGKAAALLLIKAGIKELYAGIISEHAAKVLNDYQINVEYDTLVPYIINRRNDGMCPMEATVLDVEEPEEAYLILKEKVRQMAAPQSKS